MDSARRNFQTATEVAQVMRTLGGATRVELLLGEPASSLRTSLKRTGKTLRRGDLLFFYYSGHASERHLQMAGTEFGFAELRKALSDMKHGVTVAMIDACGSGGIARAKGGKPVTTITVRFPDQPRSTGQVFISSSAENEVSQESAELRGSFFTHYLLGALRGAADVSRDGIVTLEEAYRYTYTHTLMRTAQTLSGPQHPTFDISLRGRGQLALTDLSASRSMLIMSPEVAGEVVLDNGSHVLELEKPRDRQLRLAVRSGPYRVRLRRDQRRWQGRILVPDAGSTTLTMAQLQESLDLPPTEAKGEPLTVQEATEDGGGAPASTADSLVEMAVSTGGHSGYLSNAPMVPFASVGGRFVAGRTLLEAALRVGYSEYVSPGETNLLLVDAGVVGRVTYLIGVHERIRLGAGMHVEVFGVRERLPAASGDAAASSGVAYLHSLAARVGVAVSTEVRIGATWGAGISLGGGGVVRKADGSRDLVPFGSARVGVFMAL